MLLQVAFVYWFSSLLKTDRCWFPDFTAVYYALSLDHFATAFGRALLPDLGLLKALTASSLVMESFGPFAAFLSGLLAWQFRTAVVFSFMAFHAGMALCLELGLFPWVCCVAWLAFLPGQCWDALRLPALVSRSESTPAKTAWQGVAAFFLGFVLLWNIRSTDSPVSKGSFHGG